MTALARFLARLRRDESAEAQHYRRALCFCPDNVTARVGLAKLLLLKGDYAAGWHAFEWRWCQPQAILHRRAIARPLWAGEPLNGASILLHGEQGYGDTIHSPGTYRLWPRLVATSSLKSGVREVVATGEPSPPVQWHCPLMSLPFVFRTTLETIPATVPYLSAPHADVEAWSSRLPRAAMRIGLVWAGSATHINDHRRSIPSSVLAPPEKIYGAVFVPLQQIDTNVQPADCLPFPCIDAGPELTGFSVTAGIIASLDLVISVDTSVAHLTGALGKPVWILCPLPVNTAGCWNGRTLRGNPPPACFGNLRRAIGYP